MHGRPVGGDSGEVVTDLDALRRLIEVDSRNLEYAKGGTVPTETMLKAVANCAVRYLDAWGKGDVRIAQDATENFTDAVNLYRRRMGIR